MDATAVLDQYRISLIHSQQYIRLLAELFRAGPRDEEELATILHQAVPDVRRDLTQLYRAAHVNRLQDNRWRVTSLAESVLQRLDVHRIATRRLVDSLVPDKQHASILSAWASLPEDDEQVRVRLSLFRCLDDVRQSLRPDKDAEAKSEARSFVCAILYCTDPKAQQFSLNDVADLLQMRTAAMALSLDRTETDASKWNLAQASEDCRWGLTRYLASNRSLLHFSARKYLSEEEDVARLTLTRALSAAVLGAADRGFITCTRQWDEQTVSSFWDRLLEREHFAECAKDISQRWTGVVTTNYDALLASLSARLLHTLTEEAGDPRLDRLLPQRSGPEPIQSIDIQDTVTTIARLCEYIRTEGLSRVHGGLIESLKVVVADLNRLLEPRGGGLTHRSRRRPKGRA